VQSSLIERATECRISRDHHPKIQQKRPLKKTIVVFAWNEPKKKSINHLFGSNRGWFHGVWETTLTKDIPRNGGAKRV
jgi:hypothetical protein